MDDPHLLPAADEMYGTLLARETAYEGIFVVAVRTTRVFCRPTCGARKPRRENVEFFATPRDALFAGYRPCRRCRPLEPLGGAPPWLRPLLDAVESDPARRWRDRDIRSLDLDPARVRRWFQREHGLTFQAYTRGRRLGDALGALRDGRAILETGLDHGWESASGFRDAFVRLVGGPPGRSRSRRTVVLTRLLTPLGPMIGAALDDGVALLEFADRRMLPRQLRRLVSRFEATPVPGRHPHLDTLGRELDAFFEGASLAFGVPLAVRGTAFEEACWRWLATIPAGETRTYAEGAAAVGRPSATRAFGRAVGNNPLAIVVPCHRVVGSDGRLTGYGGGIWRKRALLALEAGAEPEPATQGVVRPTRRPTGPATAALR